MLSSVVTPRHQKLPSSDTQVPFSTNQACGHVHPNLSAKLHIERALCPATSMMRDQFTAIPAHDTNADLK